MENKSKLKSWALYLAIPIVLLIVMGVLLSNRPSKSYNYSEIVGYFEDQKVTEFSLDLGSGEMAITLNEKDKNGGDTVLYYTAPNAGLLLEEIDPYIKEYNEAHPDARMVRNLIRPAETSWLTSMIPMLLVLVLGAVFWWFMMKRLNASRQADEFRKGQNQTDGRRKKENHFCGCGRRG